MTALVALDDVLALIDAVAAEPNSRTKVWLGEPSVSRLKERLRALPVAAVSEPATVHGLDAQAWFDTARRFHAGLQTIAHTHGHGIDHDWCRRQAAYYHRSRAGRHAGLADAGRARAAPHRRARPGAQPATAP
jgi:hypothetical protein